MAGEPRPLDPKEVNPQSLLGKTSGAANSILPGMSILGQNSGQMRANARPGLSERSESTPLMPRASSRVAQAIRPDMPERGVSNTMPTNTGRSGFSQKGAPMVSGFHKASEEDIRRMREEAAVNACPIKCNDVVIAERSFSVVLPNGRTAGVSSGEMFDDAGAISLMINQGCPIRVATRDERRDFLGDESYTADDALNDKMALLQEKEQELAEKEAEILKMKEEYEAKLNQVGVAKKEADKK